MFIGSMPFLRRSVVIGSCVSAASVVFVTTRSTFRAKQSASPRPICLCGPSGAGKSTLITRLQKDNPNKFGFSVSHTTRKPRQGEADGVHYWFVSLPDIKAEIEKGLFIEWAQVHGNIYGTSVAAVRNVLNSGKMCILDIDVQGVKTLKSKQNELQMNPYYIMVVPPSIEELERRLVGRGTETPETLKVRLANARTEMDQSHICDFVIVNEDIDRAYSELCEVLKDDLRK
eukprot:c2261_g1_i1.p1 GENE.c2261_g1_i1~~c2261_g1_i1.p1  ORF type:complete len:230 (+),score=43.46 c2261_g1_i1:142-831(+)